MNGPAIPNRSLFKLQLVELHETKGSLADQ